MLNRCALWAGVIHIALGLQVFTPLTDLAVAGNDGNTSIESQAAPQARAAGTRKTSASIPVRTSLGLSKEPRLGEVVSLVYSITPLEDVTEMKVSFDMLNGVQLVGDQTVFESSAGKNETKTFSIGVRFISSPVDLGVWTTGRAVLSDGTSLPLRVGARMKRRVIIDEETGQFGTEAEYKALRPEYQYDPMTGEFDDIGPRYAEYNRKRIDDLRKREPKLTDWDALYLLHDLEVLFTRTGITGEEAIDVLLKAWRMAREENVTREEALDLILKRQKVKPRRYLLHPDPHSPIAPDSADSAQASEGLTLTTKFTGCWLYKKHLYSRDTGLDTATVDHSVPRARVFIWAVWPETTYHRAAVTRTDENGDFSCTAETPIGVEVHAFPAVYMDGPENSRIRVKSDTLMMTHPIIDTDSTIWGFWDLPPRTVNSGDSLDFDTLYAGDWYGLWPYVSQPRSGAANIYAMLVDGYECLVDSGRTPSETLWSVRAKWEPDYDHSTEYLSDTIWLRGLDTTDTDEWDDGVILHEYGHHTMWHCAEWPPSFDTLHYWWMADSVDSFTGYFEGWADLFSVVVRNDSLYIDTGRGIGSDSTLVWWNAENPWQHSGTDTFQGGAYCEGGVAGALWDIFDSQNEWPYPSYPLLPDWPDDSLADTLSGGFDEIWNVFDDYDPSPPNDSPNACWTIYHFIDGWRDPLFDYDHYSVVREIFEHHRIEWDLGPNAPVGLESEIDAAKRVVVLDWGVSDTSSRLVSRPPAEGYSVFRKQPADTLFSKIATTQDTFCSDSTVLANEKYTYTVTAYDSSGYQSDTSNNVTLWIPGSDDSLATARNNAQKIVWDESDSTIYMAFSSGDRICCERSTDLGGTWAVDTVGRGGFPAIVLAPDGKLWLVWLGNVGGFGPTTVAYKSVLCTNMSPLSSIWSKVDTIWTYGNDDSLQCVSFSADSSDSKGRGHLACTYIHHDSTGSPPGHAIFAALDYFRFQLGDSAENIRRQTVTSSSWGPPPPLIGLTTVTADTDLPHIAWEQYLAWETPPRHSIMSVCGARVVADTVQWAPRTDTVSDLSKDSHRPYIEFCKEHGRIGVVWDVFDALSEKQIVCSRFKNTSWDTIRDVSDTTASSRLATMSGDCAVWSKWDSTGIAQIWKSEYDSLTLSWGTQEVLFTSDEASLYPHTLFMLADSLQFTCWTENDSSPYAIAFRIDTLSGGGGVPCFYVDAGRPEASPYLQHRGGYRSWGGEPELTVDTDPHRVSYVFSGLDPRIDYGLRTVHYFEPKETAFIGTSITSLQTAPTVRTRTGQSELLAQTEHALSLREMQAEEEDAARSCAISPARKTASVHDPSSSASLTFAREKIEKTAAEVSNHWTMAIRLDGESSNSVDIAPKSVTTFRYEVPRTLTRDGALAVEIARTSGDYALVSELYLYSTGSVGGQPVNVGQQLTVGQGHHRFRFHRLAPNPSRDRGTLAYELAASCDVKVDVFDVAGRVVATLSRPGVPPGTQEIRWGPAEDLDTQTLATGTYFVRLTARNAASGSEEFSSTRKLVLIR